jgi:hypothetical protein
MQPAITLRIYHPSIDPREIGAELGLPAARSGKAGEPRTTPKGTPLKGAWKESLWATALAGDESGRGDLRSALRDIAERLTPHESFLRRMRDEGGRAELFIGWFLDGNERLVLESDLLTRLAALGIDLDFDVYLPDPEPTADSETPDDK